MAWYNFHGQVVWIRFKKIIFNSDPHSSYMQTEDTEYRKRIRRSLLVFVKKLS